MRLNIHPSRATHQSALRVMKRRGGGFFVGKYAKSGAKKWSNELAEKLRPFKPPRPFSEPVHIDVIWVFDYPKSTPQKNREKYSWRMKRPDLDNMEKGVLDLLTKEGFFLDDSQIVSKFTAKMEGTEPCIIIRIRPLDRGPFSDFVKTYRV